ncbi:MAG: alpha/beta fold hydrolase [Pseudomonadota bacterium]|nr:alpha/beta fold hydrolase [Pseudomonadota bacterium]
MSRLSLLVAAGAVLLALLAFDHLAPRTAARIATGFERMRAGLRAHRLQVGAASMPYLDGGRGAPIVLVHGFGGDKDNFTRAARFLTPSYRVLIPDLPGFGEASRDSGAGYAIADQVARLHAFLQQLGIVGRVHLGGNSMGGFIVAEYAARYPAQVASLWLLDAAGTAAAYDNALFRHYRHSGAMPLLLRCADDFDAMLRACTFRPPALLPHSVKWQLGQRGAADFALHTRIMAEMAASPLLEQQFSTIATPALIVWGDQDSILNPSGAAALHALMPNSEVVMMANLGHLPMLEAPRASAERYLAFLRRL